MAKSKRKSKKTQQENSQYKLRPKRTRETLIKLAPAAIDSVHLAIDQIDFESLEGASAGLKELRNLQEILRELLEHRMLSQRSEIKRRKEAVDEAAFQSLESQSGQSVHIVNSGQTRRPGSHRSSN